MQSNNITNKINNNDPTAPNYNKNINNKTHEKSPFGEKEPSTHTTFK